MGNYNNLETDFIERTIRLIDQYTELIADLNFEDQFNYTLTINCLLGLIVMPKERVITFIPNDVITDAYKNDLGFEYSEIDCGITRFRDFIHQLRNSVAHFQIEVESENEDFLVDYLVFKNINGQIVARIKATEIVPFLKFYSQALLQNLQRRNSL
ncbi:HEPN family nuclease [Paraglaciecola chathamensis]|jgi:hypothetical protein|uniref:HEPN family nuclease n=1 Tax=Paraglaciecola chathamensis TaxID=368405 RepID=UPI0026F699A4|nr:HEPN family nuclease [Paraglaciecola chathamensis]MDO6840360.1 HEPN family nuclease [Paraglaciecola chathamensis]